MLTGSLAYDLDVEARKANQYTGFILKGWKGTPSYTGPALPSGTPRRSATTSSATTPSVTTPSGDYKFGGDYTFA